MRRGAALILVVAILAALIAIAAPFALSMRLEERSARGYSASIRAELAARAARDLAVRRLMDAHPDALRRAAIAAQALDDSPEDFSDPTQLRLPLVAPLPGETLFAVRDPRGTMLQAEIEDEQGKVDLNSATGELLGNLLGAAALLAPVDAATKELLLDDASPFFSDGNPETIDGLLWIDAEMLAYRHIERCEKGDAVLGLERGVFFSAPDPEILVHREGAIVRDGRGKKIAETPFWLAIGAYTPFQTVASIRDIASWQLADYYIAQLFRRGYTAEELRDRFGLGGDRFEAIARAIVPRTEPKSETETARAIDPAELSEKTPPAEDGAAEKLVESALARLGRRDGEKFLRESMKAMRSANADWKRYAQLIDARLRQREEYERRYFRDAAELLGRLRDVRDLETLSARELQQLRPYLTVSAVRPGEWVGNALVLDRIEPVPGQRVSRLRLGVRIPEVALGAVARVEGSGLVEYRRVAGASNDAIALAPPLDGTYDAQAARVLVAPPHPVNLNTAARRVLRAVFLGLEATAGGTKDDAERDFVAPREADAIVARVVAAPVKSWEDFAERLAGAVTAQEISARDALTVLHAAIEPGARGIRGATAPLCLRSGGTATVIATGVVNDRAGGEVARRAVRETLAIAPPREAVIHLDSQADFLAAMPLPNGAGLLARHAGRTSFLVDTYPVSLVREDGTVRFPSRSHAPGTGDLRAAAGEVSEDGALEVRHFRNELDGIDLGGGKIEVLSRLPQGWDPLAGAGTAALAMLGVERAEWPRRVAAPGLFEMWFKPTWTGGRHVIVDGGSGDFTDRIALFVDQGELVLRVADGALPTRAGDPWLDAAEVRARFEPKRDVWYHVAACWKGTKAGDLALFLDGLPVGEHKGVAHLRGRIDENATAISLEGSLPRGLPPRGALQIGTEVVEYEAAASGTIAIVDGRTPAERAAGAPPRGRGARGTQPRAHEPGTPVQVWGYAAPFFPEVNRATVQGMFDALVPGPKKPPNPLETTRPDGSLWRGGATITHRVPKGTPIAVLRAESGPVPPDATTIEAYPCPLEPGGRAASLAEAGFPPRGFILIEHELAYYAGIAGNRFVGLRRFVTGRPAQASRDEFVPGAPLAPIPTPQRLEYHYYGYELIELASIEVTDASDYPAYWWIALDEELFRYWRADAIDWRAHNPEQPFDVTVARNLLIVAPTAIEIELGGPNVAIENGDTQTYEGRAAEVAPDDFRAFARIQDRMNQGVRAQTGQNIPPWAFIATDYDPPGPVRVRDRMHFHLAFDWARALSGTAPAEHAAGAQARLVYALTRPYAGAGDRVTVADASGTVPNRARLEVHQGIADRSILPAALAARAGLRVRAGLVTFEEPLPAGTSFFPRQGARLLKHPTGFLPLFPPRELTLGARRRTTDIPSEEADGPLEARIDEVRIAEDKFARDWLENGERTMAATARDLRVADVDPEVETRQRLLAGLHQAERGLRPGWDPSPGAARATISASAKSFRWWRGYASFADDVNEHGAIALVDGEVVGAARASSEGVSDLRRGLLGTAPGPHSDEAPFYVLPFPPIARLEGLGGEGERFIEVTGRYGAFPARGFLGLDAEEGGGIAELLPYERVRARRLERPSDDRNRGAFRGAFGTATVRLDEGDLAYAFPFRFHDRFARGIESDEGVFWEARWSPPGAGETGGAFFRTIEVDAGRPNADVEVKLAVRIDGAPAWDAAPTNERGGLYFFEDATQPCAIEVAGRQIELRIFLTWKKDAYRRGTWKDTARVDAVRIKYVAPVRVLAASDE